MGPATNNQIRNLAIISIALSAGIAFLMLFGRKTIQLETDSTGTIHTGELKQHIKPDLK